MYKLLVIEDDHMVAKVLMRTFTMEKYEVTHKSTAGEGFQACLTEVPDLILMDINLPDDNGIEVCRRMKENQRLKHIPVILLTGDAISVENKMQGLEAGAEDYVLKPFLPDELIARVAGILRHSFNRRA